MSKNIRERLLTLFAKDLFFVIQIICIIVFMPRKTRKKHLFFFALFCIGFFAFLSLIFHQQIADYWLRLREPKDVVEAIAFLESQGFDVYPFFPLFPVAYELGISKPKWMCWKKNITDLDVADLDLFKIEKSLQAVSPYILIWRLDEKFNDDKIFIIENLNSLRQIDFQHTGISDKSIPIIAKLDIEAWINLSHTNVTKESVYLFMEYRTSSKAMRVSIPYCDINSEELSVFERAAKQYNIHFEGINVVKGKVSNE